MIKQDSWHFRLYVFMSQWDASWRGWGNPWEYPMLSSKATSHIGLCPYMRMIFIWGPLSIFSNLVPIVAVIASFIMMPVSLNGVAGVAWLLFWLIFAVAGIYAFSKWMDRRDERREALQESQLESQLPGYIEPDSFTKLLREYLMAVKTKICPVLEIEK